jgi:hypothetical protein
MRTHFLHPGYRKKRLGTTRLRNGFSRRMALRTHNLPSELLKLQLWWGRWSVFTMTKGHTNAFLHSGHSRMGFWRSRGSDVLSTRMASEVIICLQKRLGWKRWSNVSMCRKAMRFYFLHPVHRKKRQAWSRLSNILSTWMALKNDKLPSERLKNETLVISMKRNFITSKGYWNTFSKFWALKKRFVQSRRSDV